MTDSLPGVFAQDAESAWEAWRERLLSRFEASPEHDDPARLYLLVDSRSSPGLDKLLEQVPGLMRASLWSGCVLESYADIAPYLIEVEHGRLADPRDLMTRLVRHIWIEGYGQHMLTWVWSALAFDALRRHFSGYRQYVLPGNRAFFLHFYDCRILERLRMVWSEAQAQSFIAPCSEIWYRDRYQNEVVWRNSEVAMRPSGNGQFFELTEEQHARLFELGVADKLAMQLRDMYGAILDVFPDETLLERITEQVRRAGRYRITSDDDVLNYVCKGIVISPRFDEHPVIAGRLGRALSGEISHREALSGIDREVLNEAARLEVNMPVSRG
jgi:hypothetical protein